MQARAAPTLEQQQRVCDAWRTEFNHVRPHEALGMKTPSAVYRPSTQRPVLRAGGWPDDCQPRVVDARGFLRYDMLHVYVATSLAGYTIGLRSEGRLVTVWFYHLAVGCFGSGVDESVQPLVPEPVTRAVTPGGDTAAPSVLEAVTPGGGRVTARKAAAKKRYPFGERRRDGE